jgi:uncharacterized protein
METVVSVDEQIQDQLRKIVQRLVINYQPEQILLYGSVARGKSHADSDIDLLIVKETTEPPLQRRIHVRRLVAYTGRRIPFSPLVITLAELEHRLSIGDPFYLEIVESGVVPYARQ